MVGSWIERDRKIIIFVITLETINHMRVYVCFRAFVFVCMHVYVYILALLVSGTVIVI